MGDTIRRYALFCVMDQSEGPLWDENLLRALNITYRKLGHPKSDAAAYAEIFRIGIHAILKSENGLDSSGNLDKALADEIQRVKIASARQAKLEELYEQLGLDGFVDWCDENSVEWELFLEQYRLNKERAITWSERAEGWLRAYLENRGETSTEEIKRSATESGIVTTETEWSKMRTIASRSGYTGGSRGTWDTNKPNW